MLVLKNWGGVCLPARTRVCWRREVYQLPQVYWRVKGRGGLAIAHKSVYADLVPPSAEDLLSTNGQEGYS